MRYEDADAACEVHFSAFLNWRQQRGIDQSATVRRTILSMRLNREKDPNGCFVAEEAGQVIGCICSRTWGSVGWFGTFAVHPEYQGCGIGKALIDASLDYLRQDPKRTLGLETMPGSPRNLGLYLGLGFQARFPTLLLGKTLQRTSGSQLPQWSQVDPETRGRYLAEIGEATAKIQAGLDYAKEVTFASAYGLGETLVLERGERAIGFSHVGLTSPREEPTHERAHIEQLALDPDYTDHETFAQLLRASEGLAQTHGRRVLSTFANARHTWALEQLLKSGYRVWSTMLRMLHREAAADPITDDCVNLSRWAG
jgi:ribosomal protein S18 acetylase RimI-like enzyme